MIRIDSERSWDWFSAEVNSGMVSRFNRIYLEGAQASGEPAAVADLVSQNTTNLLSLRRRRALSAGTMRGVAYGLLISTIVSFNIAIAVVLRLGTDIASVAQGMQNMQVDQITENAGGLGIPVLEETGAVDENIEAVQTNYVLLIIDGDYFVRNCDSFAGRRVCFSDGADFHHDVDCSIDKLDYNFTFGCHFRCIFRPNLKQNAFESILSRPIRDGAMSRLFDEIDFVINWANELSTSAQIGLCIGLTLGLLVLLKFVILKRIGLFVNKTEVGWDNDLFVPISKRTNFSQWFCV